MNTGLTAERLRELLSYDPATGIFTWLVPPNGRVMAGRAAGNVDSYGYIRIQVDGRRYKAHRLAWLYMTGKFPALHIDHRDCDRINNRWANLREATSAENRANTGASPLNKTGLKGAKYKKRDRVWHACICINGKRVHLGTFRNPLAAHQAYVTAATRLYGEFARA